jgi:hypothetical protein
MDAVMIRTDSFTALRFRTLMLSGVLALAMAGIYSSSATTFLAAGAHGSDGPELPKVNPNEHRTGDKGDGKTVFRMETFGNEGSPMHITAMFRADLAAPWGSEATISKLDNFSNLVYTSLFVLRSSQRRAVGPFYTNWEVPRAMKSLTTT